MTSLLALLFSDIVLGFHTTMPYVYASYFLIWIAGRYAAKLKETFTFFTVPLFTGMLFYVITNFGVWATTTMYPRTVAGLFESYWMAIPFLKMTVLGDIFFFSVFYATALLLQSNSSQSVRRLEVI